MSHRPQQTRPQSPQQQPRQRKHHPVPEVPAVAAPNGAVPVPPLPAECSNPTNQNMMTRCAQAEYAQVDAELNQRYQAVKGTLSADKQDIFVKAGQAWIEFRDADCEFVQAQFAGGSIQAMIYFGCLTQLTQDRIDEIAAIPASLSYGAADQQLNQVYQDIQAVLPAPEQEQLTTAQLAWLEYRDLHCAVTGSTDPCLALLTELRTQQLQNQLDARSL
ncbi:MAG: lysozyme inhibitor LprI family protein [Cyanobacteria bacterium]|nr:lysozyme inhibitor LprI family protein [Cyanobacteriota bacterium]